MFAGEKKIPDIPLLYWMVKLYFDSNKQNTMYSTCCQLILKISSYEYLHKTDEYLHKTDKSLYATQGLIFFNTEWTLMQYLLCSWCNLSNFTQYVPVLKEIKWKRKESVLQETRCKHNVKMKFLSLQFDGITLHSRYTAAFCSQVNCVKATYQLKCRLRV